MNASCGQAIMGMGDVEGSWGRGVEGRRTDGFLMKAMRKS